MARLLPSTSDADTSDAGPRVIGLDEEAADDLLAALSSDTARTLLAELHQEPCAPSELTDSVDTSLQNVQYHLGKLEDVGVVEVVDTVYSEKGREMNVYAPADKPLVVVAGGEEETTGLRTALTSLLSGLALVGILAAVVQFLSEFSLGGTGGTEVSTQADAGGGGGMSIAEVATPTPTPTAAAGGGLLPAIDLTAPGAAFFLGGVTVLLAGFVAWYVRR